MLQRNVRRFSILLNMQENGIDEHPFTEEFTRGRGLSSICKTRVNINTLKNALELIERVNQLHFSNIEWFDEDGKKVDVKADYNGGETYFKTNTYFLLKFLSEAK